MQISHETSLRDFLISLVEVFSQKMQICNCFHCMQISHETFISLIESFCNVISRELQIAVVMIGCNFLTKPVRRHNLYSTESAFR